MITAINKPFKSAKAKMKNLRPIFGLIACLLFYKYGETDLYLTLTILLRSIPYQA